MILCIIITAAVIAADQLSKLAAIGALADGGWFDVIPGVLRFAYVENRGAAFGMLSDHRWVFMLLSAVAVILLIVYLLREKPKSRLVRLSLALIVGGGIGNMIDRTLRGYVVDFIDVTAVKFYVFNIADMAVCIGCGLLILHLISSELKERKKSGNGENLKS